MNAAKRRYWGGVVVIILGALSPARAQDVMPRPRPVESTTPLNDAGVPPPMSSPMMAGEHPVMAGDHPAVDVPPDGVGPAGDYNPCGCYFDAEYLLMKPLRRAFDFAIVDPQNNGVPQGTVESLEWDTRSGVRTGGGYRMDGWDAGVFYTYLYTNANDSVVASPGGTIFATLTHPGEIEQVGVASASSSLKYQVMDLELGRTFHPCDALWMRLFAGGRYAWIRQNLDVFYDGGDASSADVTSPVKFQGGGLRMGGQATWCFCQGFSVYACASGSLLLGDFHTALTETNNAGSTIDTDVSESFDKVVPVLEMGLGIAWQYRCLNVQVGYEIANWFGMVDSPDFVDDVDQGKLTHRTSDLSLDGLVVRAVLNF